MTRFRLAYLFLKHEEIKDKVRKGEHLSAFQSQDEPILLNMVLSVNFSRFDYGIPSIFG